MGAKSARRPLARTTVRAFVSACSEALCYPRLTDTSRCWVAWYADVETGLKYFDGTPAAEDDLVIPGACDNASAFVFMWCVPQPRPAHL